MHLVSQLFHVANTIMNCFLVTRVKYLVCNLANTIIIQSQLIYTVRQSFFGNISDLKYKCTICSIKTSNPIIITVLSAYLHVQQYLHTLAFAIRTSNNTIIHFKILAIIFDKTVIVISSTVSLGLIKFAVFKCHYN